MPHPERDRPALAHLVAGAVVASLSVAAPLRGQDTTCARASYSDSHFHLTNYVQQGITPAAYLRMMGTKVCRSTLFGIPLQQMWDHGNTGDFAPTYYLQTDAPLYYYSFTDAAIAMAFQRLKPGEQARIDPMITGFNPADMYAVDHIRRVLLTFPTVFTGIGEFSIHKEFVSSKVAGGAASLTDPALDRIFAFAGEVGLVALIHNDVGIPFPKPDQPPYMLDQLTTVLRRHPRTTIIWAHMGLGRIVRPPEDQMRIADSLLSDPALSHVHFDISWSEVAKYLTASPASVQAIAALIKKHPTRFLFGSDEVAPSTPEEMTRVYESYDPLWAALGPEASRLVRLGNYQRIFDGARTRVRAWEQAHAGEAP